MFRRSLLRHATRAARSSQPRPTASLLAARSFTSNAVRFDNPSKPDDPDDRHDRYSTAGQPGESEHEGRFSRTDNTIVVEYPSEEELPRERAIQGRGGLHFKRTLATFSLENRVALVTGGARGLGLIMSQALVQSGADVAIVDLNSEFSASTRDRADKMDRGGGQ